MTLTDDLKQHAKCKGINLLGCTSANPFLVGAEKREVDPHRFLPDAESIVVAACYVYGFETNEPSLPGAPRGKFGPWTRASLAAWHYGEKIVKEYLEKRGFKVVLTNEIPYKMAAVRSGIVYYGKNCVIHADKFGSYLKLAGVITNAKLDCMDRAIEVSDCGDCNACVDACPTKALERPYHFILDRCICAWLWGRPIPRESREKVGNYIFRCGFCQEACPKNQGLKPRKDFPFELEPKSDRPELIPLLLGKESYYIKVLPEFVMEPGIDTIRRNVTIALGNIGDRKAIPPLIKALDFKHTETRSAVAWALGRLGGPAVKEVLKKALQEEKEKEVREEIEEALCMISQI